MIIHTIFNIIAWVGGGILAFLVRRYGPPSPYPVISPLKRPFYYLEAFIGIMLGTVGIGTINLFFSGIAGMGQSVAGGLFGATVAVEFYKYRYHIKGSTGITFVPSLCFAIVVGRIGCLLSGLEDYTYGIPTGGAWGWDFGDGILRHPVALYESLTMGTFLLFFLGAVWRKDAFVLRYGFYLFIGVYGVQRFMWEFLKPYGAVWGPFNFFHIVCAAMALYAVFMIRHLGNSHHFFNQKMST